MHCLAPGRVGAVEGHCSVIVWKAPEEPNGKIMEYKIQFLTIMYSNTIRTMSAQTFYVIETKEILPKGKNIFVKVYTYMHMDHCFGRLIYSQSYIIYYKFHFLKNYLFFLCRFVLSIMQVKVFFLLLHT